MKFLDIPPVWLTGFAALAWLQSQFLDVDIRFGPDISGQLGTAFVAVGLILIGFAAFEFYRKRTTIVPHMNPSALIQSGIFLRSRNPIYLADTVILAGLILRWDAVLSVVLIPAFMWLITNRFISTEEQEMRGIFGTEFAECERKVRMWG
jgi:protein-S-isoprenylcysteine O-methyltransferase Ste14